MNKKLRKALALGLSCAMMASLLAGCGGKDNPSTSGSTSNGGAATTGSEIIPYTSKLVEVTADTKSAKDTLVFGSNGAASGCFHPTLQYSNYDREVIFLAFDRLVTKDAEGNDCINMLEINTTPGMTATSFIPQQVRAAGLDITQVLSEIVENQF